MDQTGVVKLICGSGAAGGFAGWLFALAIGPIPKLTLPELSNGFVIVLTVLTWTVLGAVAALIFTVIANTDRADNVRLSGLSLLAGMFWLPVITGAKTFVDNQVQESRKDEAQAAITKADELIAQASSAEGETKDVLLANSKAELRRAIELAERVDSATLVAEVASRTAVIDPTHLIRDQTVHQVSEQVLRFCLPDSKVGECIKEMDELPVANNEHGMPKDDKQG